ncbi:MAG: AAA family ATPase, partial [Anaerolineae bacterium]
MRLKNLELQGYKSFASRTEFDFNSGITAIVGPNGSGKSNIADAIRWVLGEQSYRSLRGKRTEDMIFVGSAARSRMGMASATLLLDNADGWLPIDFAEVSVARRAYRSGENEYMLNGSRVRLRDITELLAQSGLARRTYNVVGQGLVDAVLSLRAEDRRELFEEAAGITLYQSKRADAVTRLEETRSNLLRVNDIVNEIAPRLRRLEREAERAEHHALLTRQLEDLLRTWYGYRWRQEQRQLNRTRDSLSRREESLKHRRQALTTIQEEMSSLRARQGQLREELGDWHRESSDLHRRMEAVQRDLAVWQERARQQAGRADELEAELAELEARAAAEEERAAARRQEAGAAEDVFRAREAAVADAQSALDAHEAEQAALSRSLAGARDEVTSLAADIAGRRNRLAEVCAQRAAQVEARAGHEVALKEQQAEADALQALVAEASQAEADLLSEVEALEAKLAASRTSLEKAETRGQALAVALDDARRDAQTLEDRYQMLTRLRAEGEGLHAGVRAVLRAARGSERLAGVVGTVVQHVRVPPQYEVAVEVALGGHLQDVIVEAWRHAE